MTLTRRSFSTGLLTLPALVGLASSPARAAEVAVTIQGMKFNPADLAIKAGDTVVFTNADGMPHSATADDGSWDTGKLGKGQSASVTFDAAGSFAYHCAVHPSMKATITVA